MRKMRDVLDSSLTLITMIFSEEIADGQARSADA